MEIKAIWGKISNVLFPPRSFLDTLTFWSLVWLGMLIVDESVKDKANYSLLKILIVYGIVFMLHAINDDSRKKDARRGTGFDTKADNDTGEFVKERAKLDKKCEKPIITTGFQSERARQAKNMAELVNRTESKKYPSKRSISIRCVCKCCNNCNYSGSRLPD